jgi:hypothetical protein
LSLAEVCATVYALNVERILQERQLAAALIAGGADLDLPSLHDFDVAIGMVARPASDLTPEQAELRRELGLRGY